MSKSSPLISFVVLNWNGLEDTKECIKSIEAIQYKNIELIIVDNGSEDGSKEFFASLPNIIFVDLPKNTGFTGGHIAGRKVAKGEFIALVNNDLVLDPSWIVECLRVFETYPNAAVVGGKAFKWNNENSKFDTKNDFYSFQEVDPETGHTRTLLTGEEVCLVDSISGAALLIKQSSLEDVGYLDNDFFAYYEETDLIARLLRAGKEAYYCPTAHTWHKIAASSSDDGSFYLYMMHRNRFFYSVKNLDPKYLHRFMKNYRREAYIARLRNIRNKDNIDAKARLKAYHWSKENKELVFKAREDVLKLGESYTNHLRAAPRNDVTVIIPCYNYAEYIKDAVDSVLNQSVLPKKIIIINDGSTDNTTEVIRQFSTNPIIDIINKKNSGVVDTKNLGISLSKTYWTVFLDADDMISKTFIRDTLRMAKNGIKDIVYTDMQLFGAVDDIFKARPYSAHTLLKTNYINNTTLIKTSLLKQIGGYKSEMKHGLEDWELYITLVEAGAKPQYLPLPLMKYRQHENFANRNASVGSKEKQLEVQIKTLHRSFYRQHGYYKTLLFHCFKLFLYSLRYPGVFLVALRSVPRAIKLALSHTYGQSLAYVQKKIGL